MFVGCTMLACSESGKGADVWCCCLRPSLVEQSDIDLTERVLQL